LLLVCPTAQALAAERALTALSEPASLVTAAPGTGWPAHATSAALEHRLAAAQRGGIRDAVSHAELIASGWDGNCNRRR
jgi:hypothetical protein